MAKKKKKNRKPPRLSLPGATQPNVTRVRRPSPSDSIRKRKVAKADPVKSMLLGMAIIAVVAAFFMLPIGEKPLFNHIIDAPPSTAPAATPSGG